MKPISSKRIKSLLCLALAMLLCVPAFAACGGDDASSADSDDKNSSTDEDSGTTSAESSESTDVISAILPEKESYKLLFIGNSATYVNDIPATLASLCAKKGIKITQKQIVPGGSTIEQHAANQEVYNEIKKGYDAVFLQENGTCLINDDVRAKSLAAIEKIAKAVHESGAKFCFYVRPPYGKDLGGYNNFNQCKVFDEHFTPAAEKYNADCVYVNRAFAYVIKYHGTNLWGDDNAHTNTHGAYLAVCTFYATLFGKSATELDIAYGLPEAEAKKLQQAADKIAIDGVIPWEY